METRSKNRISHLLVLIAISAIFISGCATTEKPQKVGFLSDYSKLQKNPDFDGSYVYFNPKTPLKNYTKFIVKPVQVRLTKEAKEREVDRAKLKEMAQYTRKQFVTELKKSGYDVVNSAGPGTLILRLALTDVDPAAILANIHPAMILTGVGLGGASGEAELLDSQTGEVVVATIESQKGERGFDGLTKYGNAENVVERWAKRLVIRMDKEHGRTRK